MNYLVFGICLAYGFSALPTPSESFIARSTGCHHNGTWYADKSLVPTIEKCLNCQCNKKTLVCRLKVCPEMPVPPPRGCVIVQQKHTCCPYLSCARVEAFYKIPITRRIIAYLDHYERESIDRVVNDNMLHRRSDDSEIDLLVCVKNGTVYKSGSAMSSSNLCSYCYCIGGQEKCVKPKCMLPVEGCKPIFVDSTCCPVRYDCSSKTSGKSSQEVRYRKTANKHFLRMSQRLQRNRGCTVNKQFYAEGQKMKSDPDKPCDICFCIRGSRRCAPKKCSPALKNCIPVVPKGQCCPSSYDCGSQRDYRRAQNSRQFNLFSLLFGKDEIKSGPSTEIAVQYPHDRDPALAEVAQKYKTHQQALEASSEKSILDTIREGLEFIDGNTNHMLEENLDIVNLQAKRESVQETKNTTAADAAGELSPTTELSFLDLILDEASKDQNEKEANGNASTSSPVQDELSWVDILLGPSEKQNNITFGSQNASSSEALNGDLNIDRFDGDIEELGSNGEIIVETSDAITTESYNMSSIGTITTTKKSVADDLETAVEIPAKLQPSAIRPIPLYDTNEQSQQIEYIPTKELRSNNSSSPTTIAPIEKNDLLAAFLDGINDMLSSEDSAKISTSIHSTTQKPILMTSTLPIFKPLPTAKNHSHTRINSKIVNFVVSSPTPFASENKTNSTFKPQLGNIATINSTSATNTASTSTSTTTAMTTTTTTSATTQKSKIPTTFTTPEPIVIQTNPTILESDPLDDSTEPTLPPSLPNLKIIPFLPIDAVEAANTKVYEYFPAVSSSRDDISKNFGGYAIDINDDNKAKYIYKFKVEGPEEVLAIPEVVPKPPPETLGVETFLKYDFTEKNGFSPPTKTEGGFVPKEPLPIDDDILISGEFNVSKLNEIFPATMHIIDLTTSEPIMENSTRIIEFTTPDPFKDVIHTEPPPDLALIIKDKAKIEAMVQKAPNSTTILINENYATLNSPLPMKNSSNVVNDEPISSQSNSTIEALLDMLLGKHSLNSPIKDSISTSTVPPFKGLTQTPTTPSTMKPTTVKKKTSTTPTSRRPIRIKSTQTISPKNRTKLNATRRPMTVQPTKDNNKNKINTTTTATTIRTTATSISSSIKSTNSTVSRPKPKKSITTTAKSTTITTTATTPITTTAATPIKITHNPFLMSPFDKLPFMDPSFDIKRQQQKQKQQEQTASIMPSSTTKSHSSFERLEGLDAAYEISNAFSSSSTTISTSVVHPPYSVANEKQHAVSTSTNSLIDLTGILKLAGCNIYGRMYRVGRIILELSSPCVECKCTETGVKCGQLDC